MNSWLLERGNRWTGKVIVIKPKSSRPPHPTLQAINNDQVRMIAFHSMTSNSSFWPSYKRSGGNRTYGLEWSSLCPFLFLSDIVIPGTNFFLFAFRQKGQRRAFKRNRAQRSCCASLVSKSESQGNCTCNKNNVLCFFRSEVVLSWTLLLPSWILGNLTSHLWN